MRAWRVAGDGAGDNRARGLHGRTRTTSVRRRRCRRPIPTCHRDRDVCRRTGRPARLVDALRRRDARPAGSHCALRQPRRRAWRSPGSKRPTRCCAKSTRRCFREVDLVGGAARSRSSSAVAAPSSVRISNDVRVALSTSFEIDFWGRLRRLVESARAQALATHYARDVVTLSLAGLTTQSYFSLRSLDAQITATRETLATRDDYYDDRPASFRGRARVGSRRQSGPWRARRCVGAAQGTAAAARARRAFAGHADGRPRIEDRARRPRRSSPSRRCRRPACRRC